MAAHQLFQFFSKPFTKIVNGENMVAGQICNVATIDIYVSLFMCQQSRLFQTDVYKRQT